MTSTPIVWKNLDTGQRFIEVGEVAIYEDVGIVDGRENQSRWRYTKASNQLMDCPAFANRERIHAQYEIRRRIRLGESNPMPPNPIQIESNPIPTNSIQSNANPMRIPKNNANSRLTNPNPHAS